MRHKKPTFNLDEETKDYHSRNDRGELGHSPSLVGSKVYHTRDNLESKSVARDSQSGKNALPPKKSSTIVPKETRETRDASQPKLEVKAPTQQTTTPSTTQSQAPTTPTSAAPKQTDKSKVMITGDDILIEYVQRLVKTLPQVKDGLVNLSQVEKMEKFI